MALNHSVSQKVLVSREEDKCFNSHSSLIARKRLEYTWRVLLSQYEVCMKGDQTGGGCKLHV